MICLHEDAEALAAAAADLVMRELRAGRGRLLLAGGGTPRRTYQRLAATAVGDAAPSHLFFGDERMVPPGHADSNFAMVKDTWLDPAGLAAARVHRIPGELDADAAARQAEADLEAAVGRDVALDVALLGLGSDGHTASLFPGDPALAETDRWYVAARAGRRVTATRRLLERCGLLIFLVAGADKAEAVRAALCDPPGAVPASLVSRRPAVIWLLDRAAAERVPRSYRSDPG